MHLTSHHTKNPFPPHLSMSNTQNRGVVLQAHITPLGEAQVAMGRQGQQMLEGLDWEPGARVLALNP